MKSFYKSRLFSISASFALLTSLASCTTVDNTLGGGLLPGGDEQMQIHIDTLGLGGGETIKAYQVFADSIGRRGSMRDMRGSMNLGVGYLGADNDPYFGRTQAASILTGLPVTVVSPNIQKGRKEKIDSVRLTLNMQYISGDHSVEQTFNIYQLTDTLAYRTDSTYYSNFKYENHIGEPLFDFKYSGEPKEIEQIKLNVLPKGNEFLTNMLKADTALFWIENDNDKIEFLREFKGFVIAPSPASPKDAALYATYLPNTYLDFFYQRERDEEEMEREKVKESEVTASIQLYLDNIYGNTSVASIRHDFTGTPLNGVQNGDAIEAQGKAYVKGMGNVATMLEFPDSFFEAMDALRPSDEYKIFINQAHMYVWLEERSLEAYDNAFQKLGSYIDYKTMNAISDYYVADSESSSVTVPYDGTLNRDPDKGYYKMDITSFLQGAYLSEEEEDRRLTLAPAFTPYQPFVPLVSEIKTHGSDEPIRVKITYTLIKTGN